jgi:hypothetical protein
MATSFSIPYNLVPVSLLAPAADAAGRTSSFRSLRNCAKAYVIAKVNLGSGTVSLNTSALTNSGATLPFTSTAGVVAGAGVAGTNIPAGTTVLSFVPNTSVTLSNPISGSVASGAAITFGPFPVTFTFLQATSVSGAGSKPINAVPIWLNDATASSDALVVQNAAAAFTTDIAVAEKIIVFEILPEAAMDITNGFTAIAVQTSASNAANITDATLHVLTNFPGTKIPTTYNDIS